MKVFFDNCTSPVLAETLNGFLHHRNHSATHIRDLPCGRHASDVEWMSFLQNESNDWIVITGDGRIQKNRAERVVFRQAKLRGFVLAPGYQKTPVHQIASNLIWRWPDIETFISQVGGGSLFKLPMGKAGKFEQMPL
ncbi:PIN-like domain-containing protein [Gluconobacter japonicus]|uniref:PIN-like domain-containing protein n=1 Tax=Gluconobacter japonicus TaxID=376620 RepID=UPI0006629784|nr:hypothetical protein [Gluconobacter japonicus]KXV27987.1 hypothetical protein AD938_05680 [Gluconobacter japonicus]